MNHRLFKAFCQEIGVKHSLPLYHTEMRWLFRGRVLTRVFELRNEIEKFLRQWSSSVEVHFESEDFILSPAYLSNIFTHLNDLKNRIDCEN